MTRDNLFEPSPFLDELMEETRELEGDDAGPTAEIDLVSQLRDSPALEQANIATAFLQRELQAVLRLPSAPAQQVGFFDLGMDSLMSVELRNRLNRSLAGQFALSNSAIFDYPNVASLAAHIVEGLEGAGGANGAAREEMPAPPPRLESGNLGDSIAIVGMACRFPGAPDLSAYWDILESGRQTITDGRRDPGSWAGLTGDPMAEDPAYRLGGFVDGIDRFDARFFGIQPILARTMDPQQRMLLETTWHALEDAGIDPGRLRGSRTGLYLGIGGSEYREVIAASGGNDSFFGTTSSVTAGRVAFALGLEGPAMPIDMACASSLAAVHQAVAALERGEVDLALAAGVNALLSQPIVQFHREHGMLSESGRCSAFDAAADGFVRGEGCGVLVLRRAGEAEEDGDRIWGLVRGTALNQNGVSAAIQTPNGPAQERVMQDALDRAGVAPSEVDFLEAHGTGTLLGDAIELRAIASVYGRGRTSDQPLVVGSAKANIGHLEWASGMASIIKAVLALNRRMIPAHLNFSDPNPDFDWDRMPLRISTEAMAWPNGRDRRPLAAVNSFGLSGTNAHVVLEGYGAPATGEDPNPEPAGAPRLVSAETGVLAEQQTGPGERRVRLLPMSGKTLGAMSDLAQRYLSWLEERAELFDRNNEEAWTTLSNMAWSAGTGRSHFDHRRALPFRDAVELKQGLASLVPMEGADDQSPPTASVRTAFVYWGGPGQTGGLGRELYETEPVFRAVLDRCDEVAKEELGAPLLGALFGDGPPNGEQEEAAAYALGAGLTVLLKGAGVQPSVVYGQGAGEVAAAFASGVVSLEDGLRLLLSIKRGETSLDPIEATVPSIAWFSNGAGRVIRASDKLDKAFWYQAMSQGAASSDLSEILRELEAEFVVEIGPAHGAVSPGLVRSGTVEDLPLLQEEATREQEQFVRSLARAYSSGVPLSFQGLFAGEQRRKISIPAYPFQRRSFWVQKR